MNVAPLEPEELPKAASVLARGMRDNPLHVAVFGDDPDPWAARDPEERHLHLGPIAADAGRQRQGIGSAMMDVFCTLADDHGLLSYLETDKPENVSFYEKFGFETTGETPVLGVPNWFMRRAPR